MYSGESGVSGSSTVSVRLGASGWAWFVCGRRLLVWQYRQGQGRWAPGSQCRELTLPPSDLAHRAQLVAVYLPERANVPSCIAVSPEGAVRYWSSIAHEGSWIEENADLQGQECDSLSDMTPVGCILATTTATICLVTPKTSGGRHSILCHTLRSPQSWLGGFSRRVSSIIFGSMPASQSLETRLVKVVPLTGSDQGVDCTLLVLAGHSLQKWFLSTKDPEHMVFEFDMDRHIRDSFLNSVYDSNTNTAQELSIWMLDMQPVDGGVMLLTAAANLNSSPTIYYAAALVLTENDKPPDSFHMFCPLKFSGYYHGEDSESEGLSYQFLLYSGSALVYSRKHLLAVSVGASQEEPDRIEFVNSGDCILGGSLCGNVPVFFSRSHGLVSVTSTDSSPMDLLTASMSFTEAPSLDRHSVSQFSETANLSLTHANLEDLAGENDKPSRLKAAFVYFNRRDMNTCQDILMELFPAEYERKLDINAPLDIVITKVSEDIVNDMPAADPRWLDTHTMGPGISSTSSLQILQQLQGKQQTLELYIHFLKSAKLWSRLSAVSVRGVTVASTQIIQEHAEKLVAAVALRNLQNVHGELIDKITRSVIRQRKCTVNGGLTHLDLFFRETTKIHEAIQLLGSWSNDIVHSNKQPSEVFEMLQAANFVILGMLKEVTLFRRQRAEVFACEQQPPVCDLIEYLPWTAAPGSGGLRDTLTLQLELSMQHGARQVAGDAMSHTQLCENLLLLADLLLDGYRSHLDSLRGGEKHDLLVHQYELQRHQIIKPFLNEGMLEEATKLAEKYLDFAALVQLCDNLKNQERLEQYIHKFSEHGFSEFLLGWYMKEGKQDKLLSLFGSNSRPMQHQQALTHFLSLHPHLAWLQALRAHQYTTASNTLRQLASILSLAKLSALASDEPTGSIEATVCNIDHELRLVGLQEELPQSIMAYLNQDVDNMSVLTPEQLIELYISTENEKANEYDFKKALELLSYVEDESKKDELKQRIWCQAILRNSWESLDLADPLEACKETLFFKLLESVVNAENMENILLLDILLDCTAELGTLVNDQTFKFLMQFLYEQVDCSSQ
ncbi:hypothetical protein B566_EDAN010984 [Ephemera danica]|nr:hypothetical protein B566_EDAN010984 [Ephemera danica]